MDGGGLDNVDVDGSMRAVAAYAPPVGGAVGGVGTYIANLLVATRGDAPVGPGVVHVVAAGTGSLRSLLNAGTVGGQEVEEDGVHMVGVVHAMLWLDCTDHWAIEVVMQVVD